MTRSLTPIALMLMLLCGVEVQAQAAQPRDAPALKLTVLSAAAISAAVRNVVPRYEAASGLELEVRWVDSAAQMGRAISARRAGQEPLDVILAARPSMDKWVADGVAERESRVDFGKSFIAMAVREGVAHPDISDMRHFRQSLLQALSVAYSDSASGMYLTHWLLPHMKLSDQVRGKLVAGASAGLIVANGGAQVGLQQLSELKSVAGIEIVGLIPDSIQQMTLYSAALVKGSSQASQARAFLDYLVSPAAYKALESGGLMPAQ